MDRAQKIQRLLTLQAKLHQLAEWRLASVDRARHELAENEARLFETLNGEAPLHGLFVEAMARRLATLAREGDRLTRLREIQQRRLQEEGLKLKRFERMTRRAERQSRAEAEKRDFAALLDVLAATEDASLP